MKTIGTFSYENLLGGDFPRHRRGVTLREGTSYPAGAVLGIETATGKAALVDSTANDGTEAIYGVLAEAVDATGADAAGVAFLTGEFNQHALRFGGSDTYETHRADARALCIFFVDASRQPNE